MIKAPPYEKPPAVFQVGDRVKYEGIVYTVTASSHAHVGLEGRRYAVAAWECHRVKSQKKCSLRMKLRRNTDLSARNDR